MPTPSPRIGVASLIEHPIGELAERAAALESLGYDDIWVPDERLLRNVYISLAPWPERRRGSGWGLR